MEGAKPYKIRLVFSGCKEYSPVGLLRYIINTAPFRNPFLALRSVNQNKDMSAANPIQLIGESRHVHDLS
jgi:hypothetical protein